MIKFTKMQGTGNNYIYLDLFEDKINFDDYSLLAKKISDVNYGIGSDGLILICPSNKADCKMLMYNKDGSEGAMCGNGIRCVARYVYENILKKENMLIETNSGLKKVRIKLFNDKVKSIVVDMGKPILHAKEIPVDTKENEVINKEYVFDDKSLNITCVSMGNPHAVIFTNDVNDIEKYGKKVSESNIFPEGCNVEFVEVISENKIKMRVYERGSEETLSCGTGACASVVAGVINGYLNEKEEIEVNVLGGTLYITYDDDVYMEGPAEVVCTGNYLINK